MSVVIGSCVCFVYEGLISNDFYVAGLAIAVSLVHGGPAPKFLSLPLFQAITGDPDKVIVPLDCVPDSSRKSKLKSVRISRLT